MHYDIALIALFSVQWFDSRFVCCRF